MKILHAFMAVCLTFTPLLGQDSNPDTRDGKPLERTVRVLIAGQRAMPEFEKRGDKYIEVEPSSKWAIPTAVEIVTSREGSPAGKAGKPAAGKPVWPNQVTSLGRLKGVAVVRQRLIRSLSTRAYTPPEVSCELGDMTEPLLLVSAANSEKGWDDPQIRVIELSADKVPLRSVVAVNLTSIPLVTRFESEQGQLAPAAVKTLQLPANASDVFRFRIDVRVKNVTVPLANSSYQIGPRDRLILVAVPNRQVPPGAPPLSLQMALFPPSS